MYIIFESNSDNKHAPHQFGPDVGHRRPVDPEARVRYGHGPVGHLAEVLLVADELHPGHDACRGGRVVEASQDDAQLGCRVAIKSVSFFVLIANLNNHLARTKFSSYIQPCMLRLYWCSIICPFLSFEPTYWAITIAVKYLCVCVCDEGGGGLVRFSPSALRNLYVTVFQNTLLKRPENTLLNSQGKVFYSFLTPLDVPLQGRVQGDPEADVVFCLRGEVAAPGRRVEDGSGAEGVALHHAGVVAAVAGLVEALVVGRLWDVWN